MSQPEQPNWRELWVKAANAAPPRPSDPLAERDRLGRQTLGHVGVPRYLLMIARIDPDRVRRIPAGAIEEESEDDDGAYALLNCPCGAQRVVRSCLEQCSDCERWYCAVAPGRVFVVYGAMAPPERPATSAA